MSSAHVLHLVSLPWLHERLGRKWSADSLAPLLDAPMLRRLRELWPRIPVGPLSVLKPRLLMSLTCLKAPIPEELCLEAQSLLQLAASDPSAGGEWGRVAAGLVARQCPALFGATPPPAEIVAALDAAVGRTVAAALTSLSAMETEAGYAQMDVMSLSDLPLEVRLAPFPEEVARAWAHRPNTLFSLSPAAPEAAHLAARTQLVLAAAGAVAAASRAESAAAAAAVAAAAEGAQEGGQEGEPGRHSNCSGASATAAVAAEADKLAAEAELSRTGALLLAYVRGGDSQLALAAVGAAGDTVARVGGGAPSPSASSRVREGGATAASAPARKSSAAFSAPGSLAPPLSAAGSFSSVAAAGAAAAAGGAHTSYKRQREAPVVLDIEELRAAKRSSAAAAPPPAAAAVAATDDGAPAIDVAGAAPPAGPVPGGSDAVPAPSVIAHAAAAATTTLFSPPTVGVPTSAAPAPPSGATTILNADQLRKRISAAEAPLLDDAGRAAVLIFIENPRQAPTLPAPGGGGGAADATATAAPAAGRKATFPLSETSVAGKSGQMLHGTAVLELDYAEGKWRTIFRKKA